MNIRFSSLMGDTAPSDPAERLFGINGLDEPREKWRQGIGIEDLLGQPPYRLDAPVDTNRPNRPSDVFAVQTLLNRTGDYAPALGPNGVYTAELDDAIHALQEKNGLESDGVLLERGPTLKTLERQAFPNRAQFTSPPRNPARKMPTELPKDLRKYAPILAIGGIDLKKNAGEAEDMGLLGIAEFIKKVRSEGEWDYKLNKNLVKARKEGKIDNDTLQEFGSFHFGVVAAAAGIPLATALSGAGIYQSFFEKEEGGHKGGAILGGMGAIAAGPRPELAELATLLGAQWGDNPGNSRAIVRGWNYYHGK